MDMLKSKTIDRICCFALAMMLVLTCVVWAGKASAGLKQNVAVGYEGLFDQGVVHTIDIEMDDWDSFIASATQEAYTECSVTIDGEKITNVGIRGKGNTSLSSVATMGSQKYSFKIEFDQFVKGRSYKGLDKLSLNNLIYDATMMKDYLAYTLMEKMEVPSPLCSYAQITANGEPWGLYLAVEGVEDGFMERNNMTKGELYKPDSMGFGGGRGNGRDFDFDKFWVQEDEEASVNVESTAPEATEIPDQKEKSDQGFGSSFGGSSGAPEQNSEDEFGTSGGFSAQMPEGFTPPDGMPTFDKNAPGDSETENEGESSQAARRPSFGGGFNFGMGNNDVKLQYIDDDPESYANIFDNAKTKIGKKDKARLIASLKTLSSENAQDAVFTDEVIRYLAVHDFLQNDDSYTGMMVHNYYLYEENGRLAIIPWDYNLAFGGMGAGGDASSTVNSPIDSPVSDLSGNDRPLVSWILTDEEALKKYHTVYSQFVEEIIESGWLENEIIRVAEMIRPFVEADKNGFYTPDEFDTAIQTLQNYCALRGESIRGQLNGTIPSTSEGQRADSSALVDAGTLSISAMGTMNAGGGPGGNMPAMPGGAKEPPSDFQIPDGNANQGQTPDSSFGGSSGGPSSGASATETPAQEKPETVNTGTIDKTSSEAPSRPDNFEFPPDMQEANESRGMSWITFGIYALVLLMAIVLVMRAPGHSN